MPWDMKRLLGYIETIQLVLGVTHKDILLEGLNRLHGAPTSP